MTEKQASEDTELPLLVTAAVIQEEGKVLITRRPDDKRHPGYWEFPGGKVNPGESPEDALCREMIEELGVGVDVEGIFEVVHYRYDWGAVLILAYRCRLLEGVLRDIEVAEHRWVGLAGLAHFKMLPADVPIVERLTAI
jgi:8-oxo-dGTP diphosphatase